ncbi:MAG: DsbA family protein [Pseudomonadota bacterium]
MTNASDDTKTETADEAAIGAGGDAQHHLIYVADPMCSWCWGFAPVMTRLLDVYGSRAQLHLIMGGLRAGTTQAMDTEQKSYIRGHWENVAARSGQPFDYSLFERDDFIYDTEPACRAVVTARNIDPRLAYAMMHAIQAAFYRDARDVTSGDVLADLAEGVGLNRGVFRTALDSEDARQHTAQDFATTQRAGIPGFPTVLLGDGGSALQLVSNGYQAFEPIAARLDTLLAASP